MKEDPNSLQTCPYGSYIGYPHDTHMRNATGFRMGPIWDSLYGVAFMGPIWVPYNMYHKKEMITTNLFKVIFLLIMHGVPLYISFYPFLYLHGPAHMGPTWNPVALPIWVPYRLLSGES